MVGYIVVIEIKKIGFVSKIHNNYVEAERESKTTFSLTQHFEFGKWQDIIDCLSDCKAFTKYEVKGNQEYVGKSKSSVSNGDVTASVLEIESQTFNLAMFVRERENHSRVFDSLPDDYLEKFPSPNDIAN